MSDRRTRELVAVGLWAAAAVSWVVAMRVPWFRHGLVAGTTPLEAAELLRTGVLDVPPVTGFAVLLLPALALVLLGIAPLRGPGAMVARVLLWLVATTVGVLLVVVLAGLSSTTIGWGAALVLLGCVLGGVALGLSTVRVPQEPADRD